MKCACKSDDIVDVEEHKLRLNCMIKGDSGIDGDKFGIGIGIGIGVGVGTEEMWRKGLHEKLR